MKVVENDGGMSAGVRGWPNPLASTPALCCRRSAAFLPRLHAAEHATGHSLELAVDRGRLLEERQQILDQLPRLFIFGSSPLNFVSALAREGDGRINLAVIFSKPRSKRTLAYSWNQLI